MLATIHDSRLSIYLYPAVIYVDRGLLGNYFWYIFVAPCTVSVAQNSMAKTEEVIEDDMCVVNSRIF